MIQQSKTQRLFQISSLSICLAMSPFVTGCHDSKSATTLPTSLQAITLRAVATIKPSQAATTQPVNSNVTGTVSFVQTGSNVKVIVDLSGFAPDSTHAFHIHEHGDFTDAKLVSAGGHFNPTGHHHGAPGSPLAHAGDLGNLKADANGNVKTELTVNVFSLDPKSPLSIIGRGVIVHAGTDDLMTDPAGNSGSRIAGGKIEATK